MPIDYSLYPSDWKEISARIRAREGNKCKRCLAPNGEKVWRWGDEWVPFSRHTPDPWNLPRETLTLGGAGESYLYRAVKIVLTVAHLNHDISDNRDENLAALCQHCHLRHDAKHHAKNAAKTRRNKKVKAGQLELALQ
jgi:hypothetical protein